MLILTLTLECLALIFYQHTSLNREHKRLSVIYQHFEITNWGQFHLKRKDGGGKEESSQCGSQKHSKQVVRGLNCNKSEKYIVQNVGVDDVKIIAIPSLTFCHQLQLATILTKIIAALTWFPEQLLYDYPYTTMTTSSDLEKVDVSRISWVNCSFRIESNQLVRVWHMT